MTTSSSTTTRADAAMEARSTKPAGAGAAQHVEVGDILLVKVDEDLRRPMLVTLRWADGSASGTLFCEPDDYSCPVFRGWSRADARISMAVRSTVLLGYGVKLRPGLELGEWIPKPRHLPTGR